MIEETVLVEQMLLTNDEEMVNLGITILSQIIPYEELVVIVDKIPYFHCFLMRNIFEDKLEWTLRDKPKRDTVFVKDPTKLLKLTQKNPIL